MGAEDASFGANEAWGILRIISRLLAARDKMDAGPKQERRLCVSAGRLRVVTILLVDRRYWFN